MLQAALIPLVVQGLTAIPAIILSLKGIFGKSSATTEEKAAALSSVAAIAVTTVGSVSTGGQKETMNKLQGVLPQFQQLTENLMKLAEASGKPGEEKQAYVTGIMESALSGWEVLSTGKQAETVAAVKPQIPLVVNAWVPMLFPKNGPVIAIEDLHASE